ncbi:MAG: SDR family oxidoreductase [Gordonia sp. (in: high G+C Gram-positive bacteria)]|uniref:SDR family NAD(P)-dependent oxidoreductase n=1 Tax=Gordonia sp. (in: high G+C Gram-positive bacteria) TaxID=84139 RepID=UPI003C78BD38
MRLENKVAIVTGGAGGIGRGIVSKFLDEGASVLVVDIVPQGDGEMIVAEIANGRPAVYLDKDISVQANAAVIVDAAVDAFGKLDILVNNAHASRQAPILETTQEMWDLSMGSGMYATFHLMQAAHAQLAENKGAIVNFASGAGLKGLPTQVTYAAAKEAIRAITRVAANEWASDGIRVNLVSPVALTPGIEQWSEAFPKDYKRMLAGIPLGRLGSPADDIAPVVVFLASDDASYMTGQTLMVDGGSIMLH